jgi:hypothetical protein
MSLESSRLCLLAVSNCHFVYHSSNCEIVCPVGQFEIVSGLLISDLKYCNNCQDSRQQSVASRKWEKENIFVNAPCNKTNRSCDKKF